MAKLPFKGFPGSAHYQVHRDKFRLRYRFPHMEKPAVETSPYYASRNEKRTFLEWARRFLFSNGQVDDGWVMTVEEDARHMASLNETLCLGEAVRMHLEDCEKGNRWMPPLASTTLKGMTRPVLNAFHLEFGENRQLAKISGDEIADFVRAQGGKKETKQRRLCPISKLYTWAIKEKYLKGPNPAQGIVFWRERDEAPHDGFRKSYTDEEFDRLVEAAQTDSFALDAIYLGRYLGARPQDATHLRWEHWHWDGLYVSVPRRKTRGKGVEISRVDMHPALVEHFRSQRRESGFCLAHTGQVTKVAWPSDEDLRRRVKAQSYTAVARELGVSDTAVRKRLNRKGERGADMSRLDLGTALSGRLARITKAAGLYEKGIQPFYVLRHTFACANLRAGTPPAVVAKEMGISIRTLEKYYFHAIPRGELDSRHANRWNLTQEDV